MKDVAFIYPAFGEKLTEKDMFLYLNNKTFFEKYFKKAEIPYPESIDAFPETYESMLKDELNSQIAAYAYSCAASGLLKTSGVNPGYLAGYSLGLYSALYTAGSISFEEGLSLIRKIYNLVTDLIKGTEFGIAVIIGLEKKDLLTIVPGNSTSIEIINENNKYSFVIAGMAGEIAKVLSICIAEGGMNSRMLPIKAPYHSRFVVDAADEFLGYIKNEIGVKPASLPVVSSISQKLLTGKEEIENEIADNIKKNINWNKTVQTLISLNCTALVECGIGKSLVKIGKFIEGGKKITGFDKLILTSKQ